MMTGTTFVKFVGEKPEGFDDRPYPVLGIDVIDDQETRFLLADREGKFSWIDMSTLRRTSKPMDERGGPGPSGPYNHKTPSQFRSPAR